MILGVFLVDVRLSPVEAMFLSLSGVVAVCCLQWELKVQPLQDGDDDAEGDGGDGGGGEVQ